jgi:hypothetical protein
MDMDTIRLLVEPLRNKREHMLAQLDPCLIEEGSKGRHVQEGLRQLAVQEQGEVQSASGRFEEHPSSDSCLSIRT